MDKIKNFFTGELHLYGAAAFFTRAIYIILALSVVYGIYSQFVG